MPKNVTSDQGRALDITAKTATAAASRNSKQALTTLPELITFYNTRRVFILVVLFSFTSHKWNKKKQKGYTHLQHLKMKISI